MRGRFGLSAALAVSACALVVAACGGSDSSSSSSRWPFPSRSTSRVVYNNPTVQAPGTTKAEYQLADQYLHQLADKSGGRLFKANDRNQLDQAFSRIAEELRYQYSLGYYPQTTLESGERRMIKVKVDQPDIAVQLNNLYDYMLRRLLVANANNDLTILAEVDGLIVPLQDAWLAIGQPAAAANSHLSVVS